MTYEVELKFPLDDSEQLTEQLAQLQAEAGPPLQQCDLYFAHPGRDFATTDEALRLRSVGRRNVLTYKGPIVDDQTKTRREIEVPFADGPDAAAGIGELLGVLGFRPVRTGAKTRVPHQILWEDHSVELVLDDVEGLGTFVEIERLAEEAERHVARDSILRLAAHLGLDNSERRSYLCLLLEGDNR